MSFFQPWALFALASLPILVWIHTFLQQRRRLIVTGLFLWDERRQVPTAGRIRRRPPISWPLLLQLLAASLLSLTVALPRLTGESSVLEWYVVLDRSLSMSAGDPSPRDRAASWLEEAAAQAGARVHLIGSGERPVSLGVAESSGDLGDLLADWRPELLGSSLEAATFLALDLAGKSGEVLVLTDSLEEPITGVRWGAFGEPRDNIAWIAAARWPEPSGGTQDIVRLEVRSFAAEERSVTLHLDGEEPLRKQAITLAPDASYCWTLKAPALIGDLLARLEGDAVAFDSRLDLLSVREPPVRVRLESDLTGDGRSAVERALDALTDWRLARPGERPDLSITRNVVAGDARMIWHLGPLGSGLASGEGKTLAGPFIVRAEEPLTREVSFEGIVWPSVRELRGPIRPIVDVGTRVLLAESLEADVPTLLLNGDLGQSTFPDTVGWPMLVSNVLDRARQERPGLEPRHVLPGEPVTVRATSGSSVELVDPEGRTVQLPGSPPQVLPPMSRSGVHEVRQGGETLGRFAIHAVDAKESDLRSCESGWIEPEASTPAVRSATVDVQDPTALLIALAALAWLGSIVAARREVAS
ncbi:MAG: BatA and WFA domain-containing protein [Planctomycetota bacterium]